MKNLTVFTTVARPTDGYGEAFSISLMEQKIGLEVIELATSGVAEIYLPSAADPASSWKFYGCAKQSATSSPVNRDFPRTLHC